MVIYNSRYQYYRVCYEDANKIIASVHKKRKKRVGKEETTPKVDAKPKRLKKRVEDPNKPRLPRKKREKEEEEYTGDQEEGEEEEGDGEEEQGEEEDEYEEDEEPENPMQVIPENPLSPSATTTPTTVTTPVAPQPQPVHHPRRGRPSKQQQMLMLLSQPPLPQPPTPQVNPLGGPPSSPSGLSREDRKAAQQWKAFQQMELLQNKKRRKPQGGVSSPVSVVSPMSPPSSVSTPEPVPEKKKPGRKKANPQIKLTIPPSQEKSAPSTPTAPVSTPRTQPQPQSIVHGLQSPMVSTPKVQTTPKASTPKPATPKPMAVSPSVNHVNSVMTSSINTSNNTPKASVVVPEKPSSPVSSSSVPYFGKKAWVREHTQQATDPGVQVSTTPTSSSAPVNMKKKFLGSYYEDQSKQQNPEPVPLASVSTDIDNRSKPEPLISSGQVSDGTSSILIQQ
jgi:hypothetical protein